MGESTASTSRPATWDFRKAMLATLRLACARPLLRARAAPYSATATSQLQAAIEAVQEEMAQHRLNPTESLELNLLDLQSQQDQLQNDIKALDQASQPTSNELLNQL